MKFNLAEFLISVSIALDFIEMDILQNVTNHGKRVAYISLKIAKEMGFSEEEQFDTVSYALLHDNGALERSYQQSNDKQGENFIAHCEIGESNLNNFPFLTKQKNIILYHHENYDGTGYFKKRGAEIPIISQIIALANFIEICYSSMSKKTSLIIETLQSYKG